MKSKAHVKDPFQYLSDDHRKVETLFAKIEETTEKDVEKRENAFSELYNLLTQHSELEETTLYPKLRKIEETRPLSQEAVVEHAQAKKLLADLADMEVDSEEWTAEMKVLQEDISHHVKEEEGEMFPEAKTALGEVGIREVAEEMERFLAEPVEE